MKIALIFISLLISVSAFAEPKKVAIVKILRGEVFVLTLGKTTKLQVKDWVEDGAVVKTADKSFAKLAFIDKSEINLGPNSEMKIEKFSGTDSGVIDLVKGKIRSQVTKNHLENQKDKSKLFIKTPNAVMGIRGTDFMISFNGKNTSAVLFHGSVVFNKLDSLGISNPERLEQVVNRGVQMFPGDFSVQRQNERMPTMPALLNTKQLEILEKNESFDNRNPSNAMDDAKKSVVPQGLSGEIVSSEASAIKPAEGQQEAKHPSSSNPEGYVKGDEVKPANGSFIEINSGTIIPPGESSVLDPVTNTYIPGPEIGKVGADGNYDPPKNVEITPDGKIMVVITDPSGKSTVVEQLPSSPVKGSLDFTTTTTVAGAPLPGTTTLLPPPPKPISGGVQDVNQAVQQLNGGPKNRTIIINTGP
jgi:hypothetical protein